MDNGTLFLIIFLGIPIGIGLLIGIIGIVTAITSVEREYDATNKLSPEQRRQIKEREKREAQEYRKVKKQFGWNDKYGECYVSNDIGKILWVKNGRWILFNANDVIAYNVIERKHNETSHNGLGRAIVGGAIAGPIGAIVGAGTGFHSGDVIERLGVVFTTKNGSRYEILEYEGNGRAEKMESEIRRHNRLVRTFDEILNGKIN